MDFSEYLVLRMLVKAIQLAKANNTPIDFELETLLNEVREPASDISRTL